MKIGKVNLWVLSILTTMVISCSKDDGPAATPNSAPVVTAITFTVDETITGKIGDVEITDADGDELTVTVSTNFNDSYDITEAGALSLKAGKSLDDADNHIITVSAFDGTLTGSNTITINLTNVNKAPVPEEGQVFEVEENVEGASIGQVVVTNTDGDDLTFAIIDAENGPFEIMEDGMLIVSEGKTVDYESIDSYTITLSVTDNIIEEAVEFTVTVNVLDDVATLDLKNDPASFVTTWDITVADFELELNSGFVNPNIGGSIFDYIIDWGDGSDLEYIDKDGTPSHVYADSGLYTISIKGIFPVFDSSNTPELFGMLQWGEIEWDRLESAFEGLDRYNASDNPNLTANDFISLLNMFNGATIDFNTSIGDWDVSAVTNMSFMFNNSNVNQDISRWNTESVLNMRGMFNSNESFNQDISGWNVGAVVDMFAMFNDAAAFDQNLGSWNIANVTNMTGMLDNSGMSAPNFTATIIGWGNLDDAEIPDNITLGAANIDFCNDVELTTATNTLLNDNGWTINVTGEAVDCN